jgi:hypothetical protein
MFGQHISVVATTTRATTTTYDAFMENDGEFTIVATTDGVEVNRWVVPENVALAIADLYEREELRTAAEG